MKILCTEYNSSNQMTIVPIGDNALLRNNDDFYIPEFVQGLSCVPQWVVRINKLGKCINERFGNRYFEEVGVGIRFYADGMQNELQSLGLPTLLASAFDGSAAISALMPKEQALNMDYSFRVNGIPLFEGNMCTSPISIEQMLSVASQYYTLKIGDYLYCGNHFRYQGLKLGDRLQIYVQGKEWLDFRLK